MTKLTTRKSRLSFETAAEIRYRGKHRPLIVDVDSTGYGFSLRLKGTRQALAYTWEGAYAAAAKIEAERQRAERKQRRRFRVA